MPSGLILYCTGGKDSVGQYSGGMDPRRQQKSFSLGKERENEGGKYLLLGV